MEVFFATPREMLLLTLTFVGPIDVVAPLNINGSFYNTAIIKQNT